jgi:hypothetical protein
MKWKRYKEYKRLNGDRCGFYADLVENPAKYDTSDCRNEILLGFCPNGEIIVWD